MNEDFVVDNSMVMTWCFKDETNPYTDAVLDRLERSTAIVPAIWPLEVGNVLLVAEGRKRLSEADSTRFVALLSELPILIDGETPGRMMKDILALARRHMISTYDAPYLDLAMRKDLPFATLDKDLRKAAKRGKVFLIP